MKRLLLVFIILAGAGCATYQAGDNIKMIPISEDVWRVSQEKIPYQANSLAYEFKPGEFLLVDTPNRARDAEFLISWFKKQPDFKRLVVFNSHFHDDSAGTNSIFNQHDIETVASKLTRNHLLKVEPTNAPSRSIDIKENSAIEFVPGLVEVFYPGKSHSFDDVVVYLPKEKVLFGSCMIKDGDSIGNLKNASIPDWKVAMSRIKARYAEAEIIIPGHGHSRSPVLIDNTIRLLQEHQEK